MYVVLEALKELLDSIDISGLDLSDASKGVDIILVKARGEM